MAKHHECTRWHWLPWRWLSGCRNCTYLWRAQYRRWQDEV